MTTIVRPPHAPMPGGPRPTRPGAPPSQAAQTGLTPKEILRILRRRWLMIGVILAVFTVVFVAGTIVWRMQLPQYSARAMVELAPPKHSMTDARRILNTELLDRHKKSKAALVLQHSVLKDALESEAMKATTWHRRMTRNDPEYRKAITELEEKLTVNAMPGTNAIGIQMSMYCGSDTQKQELPVIVEAVTRAFIDAVNKETRDQRDQEIETVTESLRRYEASARRAEEQIADRYRTMEVPAMQRQKAALAIELEQLIKISSDLRDTENEMQKALDAVWTQEQEGMLASNPMVQRALDADPILRGLEADLKNSKAGMEIIQSKYGPDHSIRKNVEIRIEGLRREAESRRAELIASNVASLKSYFQQELLKAKSRLMEVNERRNGLMAKHKDLIASLNEIDRLTTVVENAGEEISIYRRRREDLMMLRDRDLPAQLAAAPQMPIEPSGPRYMVFIPLGVFLGLAVGVGLAFLLEMSDTSVKTPTDISRRVELPLLAMVPHADDMLEEVEDFRLVSLSEPHSMVAEAFRELRTNLDFSGPAESRRSLLVTSPSPDDGRTCVAVNMAVTIANSGRRVLLLDANFRRPAVANLFGFDAEPGLSDVLSGQTAWADCVRQTNVPNLFAMAAGKLPPNPNELLGGVLAKETLDAMSAGYDQVIIDGPPLLLITDARVLATRVDGVVMVVRAGVNTYGIVQRCRSTLTQIGAHVVGGVLNGVRHTAGGYLQKNYDAFQDYHEMAEA